MQARATGATVRLVLDPEANSFHIAGGKGGQQMLPQAPQEQEGESAEPPRAVMFADKAIYQFSDEVEWRLEGSDLTPDQAPQFVFFASGAATGQKLEFTIRGSRFSLEVDGLTGRPVVQETDE